MTAARANEILKILEIMDADELMNTAAMAAALCALHSTEPEVQRACMAMAESLKLFDHYGEFVDSDQNATKQRDAIAAWRMSYCF